MLRANKALVRFNGWDSEAKLLVSVTDIASEWYVEPSRRAEFRRLLARDGFVRGFVSEVFRHKTRERVWISENAHSVCDADGQVMYYEGTVEDISERVADQQALRHNEELLRQVTSQVPGVVYVLHVAPDGQRSYRFVSPGVRDIYGFGPEDLMRDPSLLSRYHHPDDVGGPQQEQQLDGQFQSEPEGEMRVVMPDGRIKWVLGRTSTVSNDDTGQLHAGVLLDITEQKQGEAALEEKSAFWKLATESAGHGVWEWNIQTGEVFYSDTIKIMLGYGDDLTEFDRRFSNRDVKQIKDTHPDDVAQMQADRAAHFEGRAPIYRNEHRLRCKNGDWKWVLTRGMVLTHDEAGRPLRAVGTYTDISEPKRSEAQRQALESQLRESQKMEAIGTLAGGVAHDFNNLLAVILGNLALARDDLASDHVAQESLNEINRAAIRARQLVQQILAFSRRQTLEQQCQPLMPLVQDALGLMRSLLPAGVRLNVRLVNAALPVMADATQIQQVVMNLCTNAWQAMDGASGDITVLLHELQLDAAQAQQMGAIEPGAYACLSVADNGPGMDAQTQRRIFEPFFTTKAPGTGTGLGLAVVHGIVKGHHGAIAVRSAPGEGTCFDVYLPLAVPASPEPEAPPDGGPAMAGLGVQERHVVYIDDYDALVFLVGRLLRKRGCRVTTFTAGDDALAWLQANPDTAVDLVLIDQNMPGLSGVEVAHKIRALRVAQRIAIVSGRVDEQLLADAAAVGVQEVLKKQDSMDALDQAIRQLLEAG